MERVDSKRKEGGSAVVGGGAYAADGGSRRNGAGRGEAEWERKERLFNQRQMVDRARLRLREGRATTFDMLAVNTVQCGIVSRKDVVELVGREADLCGLLEDARSALENEEERASCEYWEALCAYLQVLLRVDARERRVHDVVREDIMAILRGKTYAQLCELERSVTAKLRAGETVDDEYWEDLLGELVRLKTAVRLSECAAALLSARLAESQSVVADVVDVEEIVLAAGRSQSKDPQSEVQKHQEKARQREEELLANWDKSPAAVSLQQAYIERGKEDNEVVFAEEVRDVPPRVYSWARLHVPRKPRYFNTATMTTEWTKYNQAHYTADNPPPQTVKGYCFNIFYPELVDRSRVPTYRTEPDPTDPSHFQLIRFIGGAPYEDLVFRIRAFEWELGHRQHFRCTFERGVLLLHFKFRRQFYRR